MLQGEQSEEELIVVTGICHHSYLSSQRVLKYLNPVFERYIVQINQDSCRIG